MMIIPITDERLLQKIDENPSRFLANMKEYVEILTDARITDLRAHL